MTEISDPFYTPPSRGPGPGARRALGVGLIVLLLVGIAGVVAIAMRPSGAGPAASPSAGTAAGSQQPGSTGPGGPAVSPGSGGSPGSGPPTSAPGATAGPGQSPVAGDLAMPIVPVVGFWSTTDDISTADLTAALQGQHSAYPSVIVSKADRDAIGAALGITLADTVKGGDADAIRTAVRDGALGLMRASDLTPQVRALSIDGTALVGNERVKQANDWPLVITVQGSADAAWDQGTTWTMLAGGDSFTDRGVYEYVVNRHKGLDYPFGGGTARVTGHHCCGPFVAGHEVPDYKLTGNAGVVKSLVQDADLAVANFESPVPDDPTFHLHGFVFNSQPDLLSMFTDAGMDWYTIANNHIRDAGSDGVMETRKNLAAAGLGFGGAGRDLAQAAEISYLEANGTRVAMIACVAVDGESFATDTQAGGLPCYNRLVVRDIKQARQQADVVVVFAHWGVEYDRHPEQSQRDLAARWVRAGADLILGAHSHVAGAIEQIDGTMVFYSLGNFIFDQNWATDIMESYLAELTFQGDRLVQVRLHPYINIDQSQPNLLDPATDDGKALLKAVRKVSFVDW